MTDPILDEIYEARRRILEECGDDLEAYLDKLRTADQTRGGRRVTVEEVRERTRRSTVAPNRDS